MSVGCALHCSSSDWIHLSQRKREMRKNVFYTAKTSHLGQHLRIFVVGMPSFLLMTTFPNMNAINHVSCCVLQRTILYISRFKWDSESYNVVLLYTSYTKEIWLFTTIPIAGSKPLIKSRLILGNLRYGWISSFSDGYIPKA